MSRSRSGRPSFRWDDEPVLEGDRLYAEAEALLLAPGGDPGHRAAVLEAAVYLRSPETARLVERAAAGAYGPGVVGAAAEGLDELLRTRTRLDAGDPLGDRVEALRANVARAREYGWVGGGRTGSTGT